MNTTRGKTPSSCRYTPALECQTGALATVTRKCFFPSVSSSFGEMTVKFKGGKKNGGKSAYKHVPHSQKPAHLVAKRNARERRRVEAVNDAFHKLRKHVNFETKQKRLSKVKTLRVAIDYIRRLQKMIRDHDRKLEEKRHEHNRKLRSSFFRRNLHLNSNEIAPLVDGFNIKGNFWKQACKENSECLRLPSEEVTCSLPEYGSLRMSDITVLPDV